MTTTEGKKKTFDFHCRFDQIPATVLSNLVEPNTGFALV